LNDISCIYEMSMVDEKDSLKEDILKGNALDIILSLLATSKTARELSRELDIPVFSLQLYINRLINAGLVSIKSMSVNDGKMEKVYMLASKDIDILNYLKDNNVNDNNNRERDIELSAQHFSSLTRQVIKNINHYGDKTYKIKAYFIKTDDETMMGFKKDLEELFAKYQSLENEDATETYGFISVLAPYSMELNQNGKEEE
jgi:predicted transcriptional regulator